VSAMPGPWPFRWGSSSPTCAALLGRLGRGLGIYLTDFVIVSALGALYVHFGGCRWWPHLLWRQSAVIALIVHSCYRLASLAAKTGCNGSSRRVLVVTVAVKR